MLQLNRKTDVKILSEVATGNADIPVNDENSSVCNFVIADAFEIILGQYTERN